MISPSPSLEYSSLQTASNQTALLIHHTVVMGQFNYDESIESVVFWHAHWKQRFQHVVVAGPFSKDTLHQLQRDYDILAFQGRADKGYSSPMENMATVLQQYQHVDGVRGVLYLHDDTLVNITELQPWLGSSTTIIASADTSNPRDGLQDPVRRRQVADTSYRMMPDGTVRKVDGYHTNNPLQLANSMTPRWRWTECITRWYLVTMDPKSHAYREPDDNSFLIPSPSYGGSDFLYVPTSFAAPYSKAAKLMMDHQVFLECGFPKIVDILRQYHHATTVSVPLCTTFASQRGTMDMMADCDKPLAVVHPFKVGMQGQGNWTMAFDHVVNNNGNKNDI